MSASSGSDRGERKADALNESNRIELYDYETPEDLIAQQPAPDRSESRLMRLRPTSGRLSHHLFSDLPGLLRAGDALVLNDTKVAQARLICFKEGGGRVELLALDPFSSSGESDDEACAIRSCMVKSHKPLKAGMPIRIEDAGPVLTVVDEAKRGRARIKFPVPESQFPAFLERYGRPPLPPYIKGGERDKDYDRMRYQTVYARVPGAVAAPTAGLHFTAETLAALEAQGVEIVRIVLHVGPGTFTPIRVHDVSRHRMEAESFTLSETAAALLNRAVIEKRRIVAVGTSSVRALESSVSEDGFVAPGQGRTELFIRPGRQFRVIAGMITNFHLPRSTPLMMVCALAGRETILNAYSQAILLRYRFYSYGDACLILD
jgi:S-adenosylmethionine:tRNA ribosyltransferase-isomerase